MIGLALHVIKGQALSFLIGPEFSEDNLQRAHSLSDPACPLGGL